MLRRCRTYPRRRMPFRRTCFRRRSSAVRCSLRRQLRGVFLHGLQKLLHRLVLGQRDGVVLRLRILRKLVKVGDEFTGRGDLRVELVAAGDKLFVHGVLLGLGFLIFALNRLHVLAALLQGLFELAVIVHDIVYVRDAREDLRHAVRLKNKGEIQVAVVFLHGADAFAQQRRLLGLRGGRRG